MKTNNQLINDMKNLFYFLDENFSENEIVEHIESEVDDEKFYTFLIENNYFSKKEYKDYLKECLNN